MYTNRVQNTNKKFVRTSKNDVQIFRSWNTKNICVTPPPPLAQIYLYTTQTEIAILSS